MRGDGMASYQQIVHFVLVERTAKTTEGIQHGGCLGHEKDL
jgi:hypothetical protein